MAGELAACMCNSDSWHISTWYREASTIHTFTLPILVVTSKLETTDAKEMRNPE